VDHIRHRTHQCRHFPQLPLPRRVAAVLLTAQVRRKANDEQHHRGEDRFSDSPIAGRGLWFLGELHATSESITDRLSADSSA